MLHPHSFNGPRGIASRVFFCGELFIAGLQIELAKSPEKTSTTISLCSRIQKNARCISAAGFRLPDYQGVAGAAGAVVLPDVAGAVAVPEGAGVAGGAVFVKL
jgi:hypothetical protein